MGNTKIRQEKINQLMKLFKILLFSLVIVSYSIHSQEKTDFDLITETLTNYIDGTANGNSAQVKKAFHPDFKLYTVQKDSLWIRSGKKYIANIKEGKKNSRQGRIIAIDIENNAASAKAEIVIPGWRIYTDYFLLLKYEGNWKIVQKSYSFRPVPKKSERLK